MKDIQGYLKERRWYSVGFSETQYKFQKERYTVFVNIDGYWRYLPDPWKLFKTPSYLGNCTPSWPWVRRFEVDDDLLAIIKLVNEAPETYPGKIKADNEASTDK